MPDIKQVIKALECCVISDNERECPDECPYYERCWGNDDPLEYELKKDILELLKNAGLTALDLVVTQMAKKVNDDGRFFSPSEVGLALIQHGQHDNRFKWGEVIKYSPSEVQQILNEVIQDG